MKPSASKLVTSESSSSQQSSQHQPLNLSAYGAQMAQPSAIAELMQDLGEALNTNPDLLFLGGGNPAIIPEVSKVFTEHLRDMLGDPQVVTQWLGIYQSPQGNESLLESMTRYLQTRGHPVTTKNLLVVNGGQTACYRIFNTFAGTAQLSGSKHVLLPIVPEYVGYQGQLIGGDNFCVHRPKIQLVDDHRFIYQFDRAAFAIDAASGIVALSRPTNPSARVLPSLDVEWIFEQCQHAGIPLVIDSAYGQPFPNIMSEAEEFLWRPGLINVISTSKLGLPGLRTAVIVADEPVINLLMRAGAIEGLAAGNTGPMLLDRLIRSQSLESLTLLVNQFYSDKRQMALRLIHDQLSAFHYRIHEPEGAFFVWLWLPNLPISSRDLYQKLKAQGVLVMAGESFFFGEEQNWQHARECIRLNICQDEAVMSQALEIIASTLKTLYY